MAAEKNTSLPGQPVILFHGDKGGVGKSWTCSVFTDWMVKRQIPTALVDGDTRNPDVSRMFGDTLPVSNANLRSHDGWMDLTDFMVAHPDKAIVVSMPAGIGGEFRKESARFSQVVEMLHRPLTMFWVINRLPDSVNLLTEATNVIGEKLHRKFVVKNLFFGDAEKFTRWDSSETRKRFEKSGGQTINLTELQERAVDKLFSDNDNIMPFSAAAVPMTDADASPHRLTPSENLELICWLQDNHKTLDELRPTLGI